MKPHQSYEEISHLLGKQDIECELKHFTMRFFAHNAHMGYNISKQMEYEGKWRVLNGESKPQQKSAAGN